jgi:PAS domain S-box-containing protein
VAVSPFLRPGDLAAVIRGLDRAVPIVSDPAELDRVLTRGLEQARMRRRVGGAHHLLLAQQAITDHIAAGPDPTALSEKVLATLGETLGWAYGALWRPEEHSAVLRCASVWHSGSASAEIVAFAESSRTMAFAPGQDLPGRVWAFRRPAWVADVGQDPNVTRGARALRAGLLTAVAFPIALADDCAGVIEFFSAGIHEPNAEVAAMFATVGGQLAQYLERRRLELDTSRRVEAALRAQRDRARRYLDAAAAVVVVVDTDARVQLANRRACELLGSGEDALLGRDWFAVAVPEQQRAAQRAAFARLASGESGDAVAVEHGLVPAEGRPRPVGWRWALLREDSGRISGVLAWGEPQAPPSSSSSTASVVAGLAAALAARSGRRE